MIFACSKLCTEKCKVRTKGSRGAFCAIDDASLCIDVKLRQRERRAARYGVIAVEIGGALWLGNDDELGHTFWQAIDASVISAIAAQALKHSFSRARPDQGGNPNSWFQGRCCDSFPRGEVTLQVSFVTPLIINYAKDDPWIWALEALPIYDAIARLKSREHW